LPFARKIGVFGWELLRDLDDYPEEEAFSNQLKLL
jgi:hypothetical protein